MQKRPMQKQVRLLRDMDLSREQRFRLASSERMSVHRERRRRRLWGLMLVLRLLAAWLKWIGLASRASIFRSIVWPVFIGLAAVGKNFIAKLFEEFVVLREKFAGPLASLP